MCPPIFPQIIEHSLTQKPIIGSWLLHAEPGLRAVSGTDFSSLGLAFHNSMLLQLIKERLVIDIQLDSGLASVPANGLQRFEQQFGFCVARGFGEMIKAHAVIILWSVSSA